MKKLEVKQKDEVVIDKDLTEQEKVWSVFAAEQKLTDEQRDKFVTYYKLLVSHNKKYNLTALTTPLAVARHHFADSLALAKHYDMNTVKGMVDIGTGAGFPALPLKIMYPELPIILIEPSRKRQRFLLEVIKILGMDTIEIFENDWRTFVRTTQGELDLFVTRATLPFKELCRVFKPSSAYNTATLVYWASEKWQPEPEYASLVVKDHGYKLGMRKRRLIFMRKPSA